MQTRRGINRESTHAEIGVVCSVLLEISDFIHSARGRNLTAIEAKPDRLRSADVGDRRLWAGGYCDTGSIFS